MNEKELDIIKQALINENEGYQFYKMAAEQSSNEEEKHSFNKLAKEELEHIDYLEELYNELSEEDENKIDAFDIKLPESPGIFQWENVSREKGSMALSVFSIGIKMEKESVDFYKKAAEKTDIEAARRLYEVLIEWEYQHL
ncbi:MAG: ferritin-like domain-containing protein, partial [Halanaerobiales bacterium]